MTGMEVSRRRQLLNKEHGIRAETSGRLFPLEEITYQLEELCCVLGVATL